MTCTPVRGWGAEAARSMVDRCVGDEIRGAARALNVPPDMFYSQWAAGAPSQSALWRIGASPTPLEAA